MAECSKKYSFNFFLWLLSFIAWYGCKIKFSAKVFNQNQNQLRNKEDLTIKILNVYVTVKV